MIQVWKDKDKNILYSLDPLISPPLFKRPLRYLAHIFNALLFTSDKIPVAVLT